MSILSAIFKNGANEIIDSTGKLLDNVITTEEEKLEAKTKLTDTVLGVFENLAKVQQEIIITEAKGTWLQRSWRPIVMLAFAFIVIYAYFIEPAFVNPIDPISERMTEDFWMLLKLGLGGYVVGRSVEKVATKVTANTDLKLLRKKDRKDAYI